MTALVPTIKSSRRKSPPGWQTTKDGYWLSYKGSKSGFRFDVSTSGDGVIYISKKDGSHQESKELCERIEKMLTTNPATRERGRK